MSRYNNLTIGVQYLLGKFAQINMLVILVGAIYKTIIDKFHDRWSKKSGEKILNQIADCNNKLKYPKQ
jgi:uncharacterized membrane protein